MISVTTPSPDQFLNWIIDIDNIPEGTISHCADDQMENTNATK